MRTSIATVALSGTLEEKLRAAAEAGFDAVELFEDDLIASPLPPERIRSLAQELGLDIELYQPFRDVEALPPERFERGLRRARHTFQLMNRLGVTTLLVCSNCSEEAMDDDTLAAAQLRRLAEVAADHGIRIAYEALAWARHVNDALHAWRIVAAADHPALGLCLDSFHLLARQGSSSAVRYIPGEKIFFVQLADAPRPSADVRELSRHRRCFPGEGNLDLPGFVAQVLATGYRGPLSLEVFNDLFRQADPHRTAVHAMRSLLALQEALGLWLAPSPAELRGWELVGIAVDRRSAPAAAKLLRSLGFVHIARHRTEPVDLWRQGEVQILLDGREEGQDGRGEAEPRLSTLALRSADPERSGQRARALLAPPRPRRQGSVGGDVVELTAPDGTTLWLCPAEGSEGWSRGFGTPPAATAPRLDAGLSHIDHVELGQTLDHFEETLRFFRSVLDMRMEEGQELTDPGGPVQGRSLSSPSGEVRIALTAPLVGSGRMLGGQHLALACRDVFATARALRTLGAPILPVPDNYYEHLAASAELEPDLIEAMHEHDLLYDRDRHGGTFFHLYTASLGQLRFEIVQRVGGYQGLGAANAFVWRAAQRSRTGK